MSASTSPTVKPQGAPAGAPLGHALVAGVKDAFAPLLTSVDLFGRHIQMAARAFAWLPRRPFRIKNYIEAAEYIGFGSLPIVLLVGLFTGMVLTLQMVVALKVFGQQSAAGVITGKAIALELGPVLTSLMLAGRAAAGIATELGTMRITEQIDALESMAVNPLQYLVLPRIFVSMFVAPMLALLFFVVGMCGSYLVGS
ncbi:MAG: ABC transporter permease [Myxococcales bacterium]|nr:ABC transporter permease [Myxococcales bacterium]